MLRNRRTATEHRVRLNVVQLEDRRVPATLIPGFAETNIASGLSSPTAMEFDPSGRLFVTEKAGTMEIWQNGAQVNANFFTGNPLTVNSAGERGLLGITFDPDYTNNHFLYVYYTATTPAIHNRVSRFTANTAGTQVVAGSEVILFDLTNLSSATNHNGGAIHFGPDGKLYFAAGDNANGANAQTLTNVLGKIMRINSDGSIPSDNPFFSTATGQNRAIYVMGLRNPYTFTFQPVTNRMHINDVGEVTWEEIDVGVAGANYGWPTTEGVFNQSSFPSFTEPLFAYNHSTGYPVGQAITGGAFYNPTTQQFPSDYTGDYFFGDYVAGWIKRIDLTTLQVNDFATAANGPVDLRVRPDGSLIYVSINDGAVRRIVSAPRVTQTTVNDGSAQRSSVTSLTVTFNTQVTFTSTAAAAFTLSLNGGGSVGFTATPNVVNGVTVVTLDNFTGALTDGHGSLLDGRYTLTAISNQIHNGTLALDGANNGGTSNYTLNLFRMFGDVNGDATVNGLDLGVFRNAFGTQVGDPNFLSYLDFDGDGVINGFDLGQFRNRFGTTLP
jgi:glucose/arabinose dehydrogenase